MKRNNIEFVTITVPRVMIEHIITEKNIFFMKITEDTKSTISKIENDGGKVAPEDLIKIAMAEKIIAETFEDALDEALARKNERTYRN